MRTFILVALSCAALTAAAESHLEDLTIVINVRSCEPIRVTGGVAPIVYQAPVVYNGPVVYRRPVIYNGPVVYNAEPSSTTVVSIENSTPGISYTSYPCNSGYQNCNYSYFPSYNCDRYYGDSYCNPNLIRFGRIQAAREGYHFSRRR